MTKLSEATRNKLKTVSTATVAVLTVFSLFRMASLSLIMIAISITSPYG